MFKIAIDGPAGAGKSTIAKIIAKKLSIEYIDTGAMYRAITLKALRLKKNLELDSEYDFLKDTLLDIENGRVFMDNEDVSQAIRSVEITENVSYPSKLECVRTFLVNYQRRISHSKSVVMDGRDIGTVVLPDAEVKIYLDASPECRAQRRMLERNAQGIFKSLEDTIEEIIERDRKDSTRALSPLRCADDALRIDTSNMSIDEVVECILNVVYERGLIIMSEQKNYEFGQTVRGTVMNVTDNAIYLEVEEGVNAVIYVNDMLERPVGKLRDQYMEGNEFFAQVKSIGSDQKDKSIVLLTLSTKLEQDALDRERREKELEEKMAKMHEIKNADEVFAAKVLRTVKGGCELSYHNTKVFLPFSQTSLKEPELRNMKGKEIEVLITFINDEKHFIAVSQSAAEKKNKRIAKETQLGSIEVGQVLDGEVVQLLQYGAIINLGLVRGLLHISEIDHFPVGKVENVLKVGQKVKVKVIKVNGEHIGLSIKALSVHPWEKLKEQYHVGDVIQGKVSKLIEAGILIKLTDKYEGLMPKFEWSWLVTEHYENSLHEGDTVELKVMSIDDEKHRVGLSHRALKENVWGNLGVKKGDVIKVVVSQMINQGANVTFKNVVGFLPISQVTNEKRINSVGEVFPVGTEVEAKIIEFEPRKARLLVSVKALEVVEEAPVQVEEEYTFVPEDDVNDTVSLGDILDLNKDK